jgi:hypothetical protein
LRRITASIAVRLVAGAAASCARSSERQIFKRDLLRGAGLDQSGLVGVVGSAIFEIPLGGLRVAIASLVGVLVRIVSPAAINRVTGRR